MSDQDRVVREPVTTPMRTPGWTQETIVGAKTDTYLETLEQMLVSAEPRARNDPTLAVALSIKMLSLLVREVRASRDAAGPPQNAPHAPQQPETPNDTPTRLSAAPDGAETATGDGAAIEFEVDHPDAVVDYYGRALQSSGPPESGDRG